MKQAAGDLTDDERLHDEGVSDEAAGSVQEGFGRGRRKLGDAIEDIGEKDQALGEPRQRYYGWAGLGGGPAHPISVASALVKPISPSTKSSKQKAT